MLFSRLLYGPSRTRLCSKSCSTFSSVLTLENREVDHSKSSQQRKDGNIVTSGNASKYEQTTRSQMDIGRGSKFDTKKFHKRSKTDAWRTGNGWRGQAGSYKNNKDQWDHPRAFKHKNSWDNQDSSNSSTSRWDRSRTGGEWDSDADMWQKLNKPSKKSFHNKQRSGDKSGHPDSHWYQDKNSSQQDSSKPHRHSTSDWSHSKPRGKRLRKKEKQGFIESESAPSSADEEQLLYGLHPVQLALSAGLREVHRVYHRADTAPAGGRLARLVAECAARGVSTVPLPPLQLDALASGTGVHQGVCARVSPLAPLSVDQLLAGAGCPPLTGRQAPPAGAEKRGEADTDFWCVEAGVMGSDRGDIPSPSVRNSDRQLADSSLTSAYDGQLPESSGSDRQLPESSGSGVKPLQVSVPTRLASDPEVRPAGGPPEEAVEGERLARRRKVWLMLDRVQDPMNFGSIIRSSYFLGVDAIIIPDKNRSVT